jgi:beta-lactamase regulating signal transducer with metallopeptidase domain
MNTLLRIGLENAVAAVPLAAIAFVASLICRRPAVRHGLWLLVLVKFIAPPLVAVPVPWMSDEAPVAVSPAAPEPALAVADVEAIEGLAIDETPLDPPISRPPLLSAKNIVEAVVVVWLGGAACGLVLTVARVASFVRLLRHASPAPTEVVERAHALARAIDLKEAPPVWFVPGSVCPMLWALFGAPRLLLPRALWEQMEADQRDSLLLHELAHLKRRDHRVRLLEMAVSLMFWWHPVAWWARRNLREAEEQCCDAWVLWVLPKSNRAYANALLHAVDFLSRSSIRVPAAASGMGQVHHLRRRLVMIKRGGTPRMLSRGGSLALWGAAIVFLPLAPSWGRSASHAIRVQDPQPPAPPSPTPAQFAEKPDMLITFGVSDDDDDADDQGEVAALRASVARLKAELAKAQARLSAIESRRGRAETTRRGDPVLPRPARVVRDRREQPAAPSIAPSAPLPGEPPRLAQPPLPPPIADDLPAPPTPPTPVIAPAPPRAPRAPRAAAAALAPPTTAPAAEAEDALAPAPRSRLPRVAPQSPRAAARPAAPPSPEPQRRGRVMPPTRDESEPSDQRLRDVEQKLDRLIEELREIRKDRRSDPSPDSAPSPARR